MSLTLAELDGDTTLLTVNKRLAAELRARFDDRQAATGRRVWPSADILPWQAWLVRQYQVLLDTGFTAHDLLTPAQEIRLWRSIIERDREQPALLRPDAAARCAQEAYALVADWALSPSRLASLGDDETRTFLHWSAAYDELLAERGLLSPARLLPLLRTGLDEGALDPPRRLVLSGFEKLCPSQAGFLATLEARGCAVERHIERNPTGQCRRVECPDPDHELHAAATWARRLLEARPDSRIGIVTPRIASRRRDLERVLHRVLAPDSYLAAKGRQTVFDITLGEPLDRQPMVADALSLCDLLVGAQPQYRIGQLLRSPFVGGHANEWEARALFDITLRRDAPAEVDLRGLQYRLGRHAGHDPRYCPDLYERLRELAAFARGLPRRARSGDWGGQLQTALRIIGWPGDAPLDSHEFQQRERLQRLFAEFAALDKVSPAMRLGDAVAELKALAGDAMFQAESPPVPVRVLGPLEAAGLAFDALWLLDMDDQAWPPGPQPNPLLPAGLQRELDMPHASAARELAFATTLTEDLARCSPQLIASHACNDGDREQRPSPLVRAWPLLADPPAAAPHGGDLRRRCSQPGHLLPMPPPQAQRPPPEARGGASLLGAQANCPFQAVAAYRLQARPLPEPLSAPDAALIGDLVHGLLQRVWEQLRDAAGLAAHDDSGLEALVGPLAAALLDTAGQQRPDLFSPRFRALEATRLTRLACDWLAVERDRGQAFEVLALEQSQQCEIHGLALSTRADRVDRLADGTLAVIDYKTGRTTRLDGWLDDRLTEPQLPLYALHAPGDIGAALMARLRNDESGCGFVGLARQPDFGAGVRTVDQVDEELDWPRLLDTWRLAVERLATEITNGRADPTPSPQACNYCAFGALCRVREMLVEDNGD